MTKLRLFDTADIYGPGHNEILLGSVLSDRRDEVTVATKLGFVASADPAAGRISSWDLTGHVGALGWLARWVYWWRSSRLRTFPLGFLGRESVTAMNLGTL